MRADGRPAKRAVACRLGLRADSTRLTDTTLPSPRGMQRLSGPALQAQTSDYWSSHPKSDMPRESMRERDTVEAQPHIKHELRTAAFILVRATVS